MAILHDTDYWYLSMVDAHDVYTIDMALATAARMNQKRRLVGLTRRGLLEEIDGLWALTEDGREALNQERARRAVAALDAA
jgi:hypothetical protein